MMTQGMDGMADPQAVEALLRWYAEAGVDEAVGELPLDRYALSAAQAEARRQAVQSAVPAAARPAASARSPAQAPGQAPAQTPAPAGPAGGPDRPGLGAPPPRMTPSSGPVLSDRPGQARETATHVAGAAKTLAELRQAMESFDGCPLKQTATHTVFADGNPEAPLMVIGEAPGRDEDRLGLPFVGESGKLLDKMLAAIGVTRDGCYISNVLPWRPPGNRTPTDQEVAVCMPFLVRHIEIVQPRVLLLVGGMPAKTLFARPEGIMRLRGRWRTYESAGLTHPIPAMATLHPAYLLRQPQQRRLAWRDLLEVMETLRSLPTH